MEIRIKKTHTFFGLMPLLGMIVCAMSCQKTGAALSDLQRPVVEGYLVPGTPVNIKVSYQKYLDDTISYGYPITGLKLNISDGSSNIVLTESAPGTYTNRDSLYVKNNKSYQLSFAYNNTTVTATTSMPSKPTGFQSSASNQIIPTMSFGSSQSAFTPVVFNWDNLDNSYYLMVFKNTDQYKTPVNTINTDTYSDSEVILGQVNTYQTQPRTFRWLGNFNVLLFHINKEYSDALTSNSSTSLNLTNPATNIVNGLGIFTALQADTVKLFVKH